MTTPYYADADVQLWHGDALDVLQQLPDGSVDAVVTDPPYGLEFMGREWDSFDRRAYQAWCQAWAAHCLRVLKPGGHLLAFGGTRTYHRLTCAIEDAGFEIRDEIAWIYASGFPKSLNVSKDERFCRCWMGESGRAEPQAEHDMHGLRGADVSAPVRAGGGSGPLLLAGLPESGTPCDWPLPIEGPAAGPQSRLEGRRDLQASEGELHRPEVRPLSAGVRRDGEVGWVRDGAPTGDGQADRAAAATDRSGGPRGPQPAEQRPLESAAVPEQRGPQAGRGRSLCGRCDKPSIPPGLGTALKPAHEPIVVARKPLAGTVAANVLAHGTGALNIDGCRVEHASDADLAASKAKNPGRTDLVTSGTYGADRPQQSVNDAGRWPSNVVLDEYAAAELDRQSGISRDGVAVHRNRPGGEYQAPSAFGVYGNDPRPDIGYGGEGGASRFFPVFRYEPKAPTTERPRDGGEAHPTVKPLDLMRWLVRLVTPPGGLVLDPFAGSGTTAEACVIEGFRCITIERHAPYLPLIVARLSKPLQPVLEIA